MKKISTLLLLGFALCMLIACGPAESDVVDETGGSADPVAVDEKLDIGEPFEAESAGAAQQPQQPQQVAPADLPAEPTDALLGQIPAYDKSDIQTTTSGLQYVIYEEGSGDKPITGDTVVANYSGYLSDGTKFDSSIDRGTPFEFAIGRGAVIQGWDEGFALMNPGTKALLIIPSDLGYGPNGSGSIPPGATLYFDVELLDIKQPAKAVAVAEGDYTTTDSGLMYYDIEVGSGDAVEVGQVAGVDFAYWTDGVFEQSSKDTGQPLFFPVGVDQFVPGIDEGVQGMKVGGKRQLVLSGDLVEGSPLPPTGENVFEVELLSISPGPPDAPTSLKDGDYETLENGIQTADLAEGDGDAIAEDGNYLVNYTVWDFAGQLLGSSFYSGQPIAFSIGDPNFPGWSEGMAGMNVGGTRQIMIPPEITNIPSLTETLTVEVEVVDTVPAP